MIAIALVHNHYDKQHLEKVKGEMQSLGAPTIKAVWMECWGIWAALEGCHRIRAAAELGLMPEIDEVEYSEEITTADIGLSDAFDGEIWTIADLADNAYANTIIRIAE